LDKYEREGGVRNAVIRNGAITFIFLLRMNNSAVPACSCKVEADEREEVFIYSKIFTNSQ